MTTECPFCPLVDENKVKAGSCLLLKPLNPVTEGHMLVVSREHLDNAFMMPSVTAELWKVADEYAQHLTSFLGVTDYNIITSVGPAATQTVRHLHIHIVPRREGDGLHLPWTGQIKS